MARSPGNSRRFADRVLAQRQSMAERGGGRILAARDWMWWPANTFGQSQFGESVLFLLSAPSVDWDEALKLVNRNLDLEVAFLRATAVSERRQARASLQSEEQSRQRAEEALATEPRRHTELEDRARALDEIGRTPEGRRRLAALLSAPPALARAGVAWNEGETQFRLGVTAVALAVHRLEKGSFPANLEALAPEYLKDHLAPSAPLPGYICRYQTGASDRGGLVVRYALTAVPEEKGETGNRGFCVDSTGAMRFTIDGTAPKVRDGMSDPGMRLVG